MAKFDPPEKFHLTQPNRWPEWKQRFERFRVAAKLNKESEDVQISSLVYSMGPEAEHIMKTILSDKSSKYDDVIKEFDDHFVPKKNIIFERARFRNRVQNSGENVETFERSLYELAEHCNFGNAKDDNIRDSIVIGLLDKQVSQQLQMESSLTLTNAIEKARHAELVKSQNVVSSPMSPPVLLMLYVLDPVNLRVTREM